MWRWRKLHCMVAPPLLQDPAVKRWLAGTEPAWILLDRRSLEALNRPPRAPGGAIRLAADLLLDEIERSAVAHNALVLLRSASEGTGLRLTATGNLARQVVAEMRELMIWPDFDKAEAFRFHKVVNEPDFLPLHLIRHVAEAAGVVRRHKGNLKSTPAGRQLQEEPGRRALLAIFFHVAMWGLDLQYLSRGILGGWPQCGIGVILWSISVSANEWQSRERLTRMCCIPSKAVVESTWDAGSFAMEATVLRLLRDFGLLEHRSESIPGQRFAENHFYRKTALFDRFLSFDVDLEADGMSRH
jgi:hypothetical protein